MIGIFIVLVIVIFFAIALIQLLQQQEVKPNEFPYRKLDAFFSPAERSFLGVLIQAAGSDTQVFGKVRVADVIAPQKGMSRSDWQKAFNKISGKHFDYLLCDKNDLSVLCAIELDDSSHNSKKRKYRDEFLKGACQSANVPLIQVSAKARYSIHEIHQSIAAYLPHNQSQDTMQELTVSYAGKQPNEVDKICPECSSAMVIRTAKRGKNIGQKFWACSAFPKCRHTEAITAEQGH